MRIKKEMEMVCSSGDGGGGGGSWAGTHGARLGICQTIPGRSNLSSAETHGQECPAFVSVPVNKRS